VIFFYLLLPRFCHSLASLQRYIALIMSRYMPQSALSFSLSHFRAIYIFVWRINYAEMTHFFYWRRKNDALSICTTWYSIRFRIFFYLIFRYSFFKTIRYNDVHNTYTFLPYMHHYVTEWRLSFIICRAPGASCFRLIIDNILFRHLHELTNDMYIT